MKVLRIIFTVLILVVLTVDTVVNKNSTLLNLLIFCVDIYYCVIFYKMIVNIKTN